MSSADEQAVAAAQSLRALECATASQGTADVTDGKKRERETEAGEERQAGGGDNPLSGANRHTQTEQRRRNRINEGYSALRELIPSKEKSDKATFLMAVVQYVRQLQGVLQRLMESGTVSKLPEDLQWSIRSAGYGSLVAQQAAMAQLQLLQQLVSAASAGLPAQPSPAVQAQTSLPMANASMMLAPDVLAVLAQQMQALPGLAPATGSLAVEAMRGGASANSSSSQEEGSTWGVPKPRKGPKVRRHTTAAKFTQPQGSPDDGGGLGRPSNGD
ncbi:hypothetical protein WJX81_006158 [Elliptochloris bilobata]|uniref:BHLH domain-containing protein n=1 Tax=Elliptochloris bilobata TaxID=381761 RepID=A0AAW1S390_9CHLO